ncbi:hypothetical protein O181_108767 [Austropuccinia psidii MF-1]|uniref:Uncharacterized protein n=1 Tax=Austropuccinia psidii MF-1 TaxID=1389203 RepID=A0A9Q3JUV2_9BASI|nr:hypothetical protein [Austropuccinia psidii MF-1]
MMKQYPSANGHRDLKQAKGNDSRQLALCPQASICPPPLLGHHPMVTSLLDLTEVIIRPMKDGNGNRTFKLGLIIIMFCHRWDSNAKNKKPQIPPNKTLPFLVCLASKRRGNPLQARVAPDEPSQTKEPPIPGPSPSSQPPEDNTTREPEPQVAPTQSTEEPFGKSQFHFFNSTQLFLTPPLTISSLSRHSPLHNNHRRYARWIPPSPFFLPNSPTFPFCSPRFPPQRSLPVPLRTPTPPPPSAKPLSFPR